MSKVNIFEKSIDFVVYVCYDCTVEYIFLDICSIISEKYIYRGKDMKKLFGTTFVAISLCVCIVFCFFGCDDTQVKIDDAVNEAVAPLEDKIADLNKDIADKEAKIKALETEKKDLFEEKTKLETDIKSLQTDIASLKTEKDALSAKVSELEVSGDTKNSEIASLKAEIAALETETKKLEAEKADLLNTLAALEDSCGKKDEEIGKLKQNINTLESEKSDLTNRLEELNSSLIERRAEISKLEGEKESIQNEKENLELENEARRNCLEKGHSADPECEFNDYNTHDEFYSCCNITVLNVNHTYKNGVCKCGNLMAPTLNNGIYEICNAGNLLWLANYVNSGNPAADAALKSDIDMTGLEYIPIGNSSKNKYAGNFDGEGHTVYGIVCNDTRADEYLYSGFFGYVGNGTRNVKIKNLIVKGSFTATSTANGLGFVHLGGILGHVGDDRVIIENCAFIGSVTANNNHGTCLGGVVGSATFATITNCYAIATVTHNDMKYPNAGAFVGSTNSTFTYNNCYADTTVCPLDLYCYENGTVDGIYGKTSTEFDNGTVATALGSAWEQKEGYSYPTLKSN